jgi:hypothetical protein
VQESWRTVPSCFPGGRSICLCYARRTAGSTGLDIAATATEAKLCPACAVALLTMPAVLPAASRLIAAYRVRLECSLNCSPIIADFLALSTQKAVISTLSKHRGAFEHTSHQATKQQSQRAMGPRPGWQTARGFAESKRLPAVKNQSSGFAARPCELEPEPAR